MLLPVYDSLVSCRQLFRVAWLAIFILMGGHLTALAQLRADLRQQLESLLSEGRNEEAIELSKQILSQVGKQYGADSGNFGDILLSMGQIYEQINDPINADINYRRAIAVYDKAFGIGSPSTKADAFRITQGLGVLARSLAAQGRLSEAYTLQQRAYATANTEIGSDHWVTGVALAQLADSESQLGRHGDAEPHFTVALRNLADNFDAISNDPIGGPRRAKHALLAVLRNAGENLLALNKLDEADALFTRLLTYSIREYGNDESINAYPLLALGQLRYRQGRYKDAKALTLKSLAFFDQHDMLSHRNDYSSAYGLLGLINEKLGLLDESVVALQKSDQIYWRTQTNSTYLRGDPELRSSTRRSFAGPLASVALQLARANSIARNQLFAISFEAAQRDVSSASARALAQMSSRRALKSTKAAELMRRRQDIQDRLNVLDKELTKELGIASRAQSAQSREEARSQIGKLSNELTLVNEALVTEAGANVSTDEQQFVTFEAVQGQLRTNEVAIMFFYVEQQPGRSGELLSWAITKTELRHTRREIEKVDLLSLVQKIRCGLDYSLWVGSDCKAAPELHYSKIERKAGGLIPFSAKSASNLYNILFGEFRELLVEKELIVSPGNILGSLPFPALLMQKPESDILKSGADFSKQSWFGLKHAITIVPSISSIPLMRQKFIKRMVTSSYLGVGNPLLRGRQGDIRYQTAYREALTRQSCVPNPGDKSVAALRSGSAPARQVDLLRGVANTKQLQNQMSLPETADEVCTVSKILDARQRVVLLGERATESAIKRLSANGELLKAGIIHFATHGLLARETQQVSGGIFEPALILTPPDSPTEFDDGLLTASEITQLKLDADWVVLSACNTDSGTDRYDGEALSGLARAFFYAGAQSLLVSHWYVDSLSATELITKTFNEYKLNPNASRARALSRAMKKLQSTIGLESPEFWAPFAVVGAN